MLLLSISSTFYVRIFRTNVIFLVMFWLCQKNSYEKFARLTLVKLTASYLKLLKITHYGSRPIASTVLTCFVKCQSQLIIEGNVLSNSYFLCYLQLIYFYTSFLQGFSTIYDFLSHQLKKGWEPLLYTTSQLENFALVFQHFQRRRMCCDETE